MFQLEDLNRELSQSHHNEAHTKSQLDELKLREERLMVQLEQSRQESLTLASHLHNTQSQLQQLQGHTAVKVS
jgi:stress response protein YsnF